MIRNKDIVGMQKVDLRAFSRWLTNHGAPEIIEVNCNRSITFRADDSECVVVNKQDGKVKAWPTSAKEACHAYLNKYDIDLQNGIEIPPVEDWHEVGREIAILAQRFELKNLSWRTMEAWRLGITIDRLDRALSAFADSEVHLATISIWREAA